MSEVVSDPRLLIGFDLSKAGQWDSHGKTTTTHHNYQWTAEQWRYIERSAFRMLLATMNGEAEWGRWDDAIPPEALDFWDDEAPEELFGPIDDDRHLNGVSTAIGVVDAILGQFEEEAAKRDV